MDRRQRLASGVGVLLLSLAIEGALFITPLERRLLNPTAWFVIVVGVQLVATMAFVTAATKRDTLGTVALVLAAVTVLLIAGLAFIFIAVLGLSGLR